MVRESSLSNVFARDRAPGKANVLLHVGRNALDRDAHFPGRRDHSPAVVNPHTHVLSYALLHRAVLHRCRWVSERRLRPDSQVAASSALSPLLRPNPGGCRLEPPSVLRVALKAQETPEDGCHKRLDSPVCMYRLTLVVQ